MNKERYFIWKNYEKLQELVNSVNNTSGESTDSPEDIDEDEGEGEGE